MVDESKIEKEMREEERRMYTPSFLCQKCDESFDVLYPVDEKDFIVKNSDDAVRWICESCVRG